jgi:hypothetical protein
MVNQDLAATRAFSIPLNFPDISMTVEHLLPSELVALQDPINQIGNLPDANEYRLLFSISTLSEVKIMQTSKRPCNPFYLHALRPPVDALFDNCVAQIEQT